MTFLEIVNEVLFDRFADTRRESIERYVNARYGRVWASENWAFKRVVVPVSLVAGDSEITLTELGLQRVEAVYRSSGTSYYSVEPTRPEDFFRWATTSQVSPVGFTIYGDSLHFENSPSSTESLYVLGELKFEPLVEDGNVPLIPEEFHMMLVHGAASEALRMENDPTWVGFEQDYQAYKEDMKLGYLSAVRTYGDAFPAWIPNAW